MPCLTSSCLSHTLLRDLYVLSCSFKSSLDLLGNGVSLGHLKEIGGWSFSIEGMFNGYAPESKVG